MIYESGKMRLLPVATKSIGQVNDCYICRDLASSGGILYTVIVVHDHELVRNILELFKFSNRKGEEVLIDAFAAGDKHVMVFPFHNERPLFDFYEGESLTLSQCEDICISAILACITSDLPYPILYLLLSGNMLNLASDGSVFLGYEMDLSKLDMSITEKECTNLCAKILLELLEPKSGQKATSYYLLEKKVANGSYQKFPDLYRDVTIAAVTKKKITPFFVLKLWLKRNADTFFGILFWISLILGIIAVSIILSRFFLGGNSWFRLLFNTFKNIGTESLVQ
ncbi:hypothetical protein [Butyrivibrio sp. AE3004]|uniref:hypothetical protein n=1 Tax=Butyrivibrio sp. AE3004 TaxID=1506994 RepID=UPI000493F687|nr:hypothetical protein [Butyrivibrio sp. AE3004]